jgi:hypothetical protein
MVQARPEASRRVARPPADLDRTRPLGVRLVALGFAALALGAALVGLLMLVLGPGVAVGAFPLLDPAIALLGPAAPVLGALALLLAVAAGLAAWGLLRGRALGWRAALGIAGLGALAGVVDVARGEGAALLDVLVWAGVAFYLLQPETRGRFRGG